MLRLSLIETDSLLLNHNPLLVVVPKHILHPCAIIPGKIPNQDIDQLQECRYYLSFIYQSSEIKNLIHTLTSK